MPSKKTGLQDAPEKHQSHQVQNKSQSSKLKMIFVRIFQTLLIVIITLVILAPVLLRSHGDIILKRLFFQTWSRYYPWLDITKPENFGLNGVNVYEQIEPNVTVGIWYILPTDVQTDPNLKTLGEHLRRYVKGADQTIIMYLHGQDGTRATHYRSNHYRVMSEIGNHIIAFDYRGYGDSSGSPNTHGLVQDVVHIYERIREVCPNNPVTIWGHSMGTGVALLSVNFLYYNQTKWPKPSGVVLEAPFYNVIEGLISYPLTRVLKINPFFMDAALDALGTVEINFPNNEIISYLPLPIAIIHAEDDGIIPYYHAQLIQEYVQKHRDPKLPPVRLITIPSGVGCGHNHIYYYKKFPEIVRDLSFLKQTTSV